MANPKHREGQPPPRRPRETDADRVERARGLAADAMRQQHNVWRAADGVVLERRGMTLIVHLEYTAHCSAGASADAATPRRRASVNMDTNVVTITTL
jgi:hypothetical protein